ncbi:rhodanese-like domain-containing protein [Mammaliicoccus sp. Dog046]|uniref:rhodanese-like domain-containing protein n=1 Tax=Mammaliicoccus sp. Dog046 TaxID=3034233 RepID=UPI002B25A05E|nr:rhodanese-like domain-containing protein [Mammaliicoccus sp. Dog046]WQK86394.1 rhodanese-like domain-containing protein [Mammaliicoccus sp. Dog046]
MKEINVTELANMITSNDPINIVDVREDHEVAFGMIPGAKHIPMGEIPNELSNFNEKQTYYIVCAGGVRSANVVEYLNDHDIDAVNIEGGMHAWGDEGLEFKGI